VYTAAYHPGSGDSSSHHHIYFLKTVATFVVAFTINLIKPTAVYFKGIKYSGLEFNVKIN
jgi:hypothetical protein